MAKPTIDQPNWGTTLNDHLDSLASDIDALSATFAKVTESALNPARYGAVGDGVTDDMAAIHAALAAGDDVLLRPGQYATSGTILIPEGKSLTLAPGAAITRPTTLSTSTEPLVWMRENSATLKGGGMRVSEITTQNGAPFGVVCIGNKGFADATGRQANYNTVADLAIIGRQPGGETTGTASTALYLCNNEISGLTSYFNTVKNLYLAASNIGLALAGNANANIVQNLQLNGVGNDQTLDGAALALIQSGVLVPIENHLDGLFHTFSSNALTVLLSGADIAYNTLNGVMSEQGGVSALWIKNTNDAAANNEITGSANVAGGLSVTANFLTKNRVGYDANMFAGNMTANNVSVDLIKFTADPTATAPAAGAAGAIPGAPNGWYPIQVYGETRYLPYW